MSFEPAQSRAEMILQNILGADNALEPPQSREEVLLMALLEQGVDPAKISEAVTAWMDENITQPTDPVVDASLSVSGAAADAAKTGEVKALAIDLDHILNGEISVNYTEGKNLSANSVSHNIVDNANACVSDFIPATWGSGKVKFYYTDDTTDATAYQVWWFDSDKEYIGYVGRNVAGQNTRENLTPPSGTAYARISFKKGFAGKLTENASTPTTIYYEATETVVSEGLVSDVAGILPITPQKTEFFHISKNMLDPSLCVNGEYVNQSNGNFGESTGQMRTGYIEIEPSTTYVVRKEDGAFGNNFRYVFYTAQKTYISGAVGALSDMLLTSPATAKYIVISDAYPLSLAMIAKYVNSDKTYESYNSTHILSKYIQHEVDIPMNVPQKIYALVGFETNIYFENIVEKWQDYSWDVTCDKGAQYARGYKITPSASDVGTYAMTIRAYKSETEYKEVSTTLVVASASAGSGETASIIILGDSTTDNGQAVAHLNGNFADDVMGVATLGTRGTAPNNHEGRSGWKISDYFTKASITYTDGRGTIYNPFYNPSAQTFDADYYFSNSGIAKPDWFAINLGINDVFSYTHDAELEKAMETVLARYEEMVQSVLDATTSTKVCVCVTIPPNNSQDAFGKAYGCNETRDRVKRNNTIFANALIEQFDGRENENIFVIPIHTNLDTIYNMGMESIQVNARNETTYQSPIGNGAAHPSESGYWQIADIYTAFLKGNA